MLRKTGIVLFIICSNATAASINIGVNKSVPTTIDAAYKALIQEGYSVPYIDPDDGIIRATRRDVVLPDIEATCPLMDGKTPRQNVEIMLKATEITIDIQAEISAAPPPGAINMPYMDLSCKHDGSLENRLLELIKQSALTASAQNLQAKYDPNPPDPNLAKSPRSPNEAIEVIDTKMNIREVEYRDAVTLSLNYKSKTQKRIIGIVTRVTATNAFGKVVLSEKLEDETTIEPGELGASNGYWHWQNNKFIDGEPYDRMWQSVSNDTIKVKTQILKIIFDDGTKVETVTTPKHKK